MYLFYLFTFGEGRKIVRYLGSKTLLLEQIYDIIAEYKGGVFCDPFGGIGTVGSFMKHKGFSILSNDILLFPYYFQYTLIDRGEEFSFLNLQHFLGVNSLEGIEEKLSSFFVDDGWLIQEYSKKRLFFSIENACLIQGCINNIELWYKSKVIDENERKVLLASLINSIDKVANTAGTYYAHLKQLDRRAKKVFRFKFLHCIKGPESHAFNMEAEVFVKNVKCDVLYLDPPYNERDYSAYYHLPETIAAGVVPIPKGKSGVYQVNDIVSDYNKRDKALQAFERLISYADTKCIILHYTDSGLIDINDAKNVLISVGNITTDCYVNCKGYTTFQTSKANMHHIIKCCK